MKALVTIVAFCAACATYVAPETRRAIEDGEALYDRRQYGEAAAALKASMLREMPDRYRADVSFLYARALLKSGRVEAARNEFARIAREYPRHFKAARSLEALAESAPDVEAMKRRWLKLIRRYPSSHPARNGVKWFAEQIARVESDPRGAVTLFMSLYRRDPVGPLADLLLYTAATILEDSLADVENAERLYVKIAEEFGEGGLSDDARWRLALILRKQRRLEELVRHLRGVVEERRINWSMGSYNSRHVEPSQLLLARIFLEDLKLYPEARDELDLFEEAFPLSLQRREAIWMRAASFAAEGRVADARRVLEGIVRDHPDTRFSRRAKRALDGLDPLPGAPRMPPAQLPEPAP